MLTRGQSFIIKLDKYIDSFNQDNNYAGPPDEKQSLENLKDAYKTLSKQDKALVRNHYQTRRSQALTPEEMKIYAKSSSDVLYSAALGALAGAAGGAILANGATLPVNSFLKSACQTGVTIVSSGLGAVGLSLFASSRISHTDIKLIAGKLQPYNLALHIFDKDFLVSAERMRSVVTNDGVGTGLRQRR